MYKVIVFDLDLTLWWCESTWIDMSGGVPFNRIGEDTLSDRIGEKLELFPDVRRILSDLEARGYILAVASRSSASTWAHEALEQLGISAFFSEVLIFTGSKVAHFDIIKNRTGLSYSDMIFFDDEDRNIFDVSKLGVDCVQVKSGIEYQHIQDLI